MLCPCHSGFLYKECCQSYHIGEKFPLNALELMRSRYSAYALKLVDYIINTTHPENPSRYENPLLFRKSIFEFCNQTSFEGLDIIEFEDGKNEAFVTFFAKLKQNNKNASFQEKSRFIKFGQKWLYHSADKILG